MRSRLSLAALALPLLVLAACGQDDEGDPVLADTDDTVCRDCGDADDGGRDDAAPVDSGEDVDPDGSEPVEPGLDSDGDGIPDAIEGSGDPDGDGIPNYLDLDSDGDGIPDEIEGTGDPDGDGIPNFLDLDSDGDTWPDSEEGNVDSDGDGVPDFLDTDSDGDGIPDRFEERGDEDGDGIPNRLDLDSDGDGWPDAVEYGQLRDSGLRPIDTDSDGIPNFLDLDSDGDGLPDSEELGCPDSTERLLFDSDGDGINDLVEVGFSLDPDDIGQACDAARGIDDDVDFYFELPYREGDVAQDELEFTTDVRRADVHFNMDTTGSMSQEINALRTNLTSSIIPQLGATFEDVAFGVSQFDDFPCNGHGADVDRPLILRQRVTTSAGAAQAGVNALALHSGADQYESGFESLYQLATGFGRRNTFSCLSSLPASGWLVPPFDPAVGYIAGQADGAVGGAGFREGSVPVIIHITDAPSHAKGESGGSSGDYRYGASRTETLGALNNIGAKVIGVASDSQARADLEQMTAAARSAVPTCAWDGFRPAGCVAGQCCTGRSGAGRAPAIGGLCPLVYDIDGSTGFGLDTSIITGIQALVRFSSLDLVTRVRPDEALLAAEGIDTACFLTSVRPTTFSVAEGPCSSDPTLLDLNRDGVNDGFANVIPGTLLRFDVEAFNDCVPADRLPRVYQAWIDVVEPRGAAVLDSRLVTILVPPTLKP